MKIGILFQYHHTIGVVLGKHIRPCPHRIPIKRDIFFRQPFLGIKALCLPWNGREKSHCQPVHKLGVLTLDLDAIGIAIDCLRAFQRINV